MHRAPSGYTTMSSATRTPVASPGVARARARPQSAHVRAQARGGEAHRPNDALDYHRNAGQAAEGHLNLEGNGRPGQGFTERFRNTVSQGVLLY